MQVIAQYASSCKQEGKSQFRSVSGIAWVALTKTATKYHVKAKVNMANSAGAEDLEFRSQNRLHQHNVGKQQCHSQAAILKYINRLKKGGKRACEKHVLR